MYPFLAWFLSSFESLRQYLLNDVHFIHFGGVFLELPFRYDGWEIILVPITCKWVRRFSWDMNQLKASIQAFMNSPRSCWKLVQSFRISDSHAPWLPAFHRAQEVGKIPVHRTSDIWLNPPVKHVHSIAEVTKAVAGGDLTKEIEVDVRGEILELKETVNGLAESLLVKWLRSRGKWATKEGS
jgi:hypothetical protein